MGIVECGIRVQNIKQLEAILSNSYAPNSKVDQLVFDEMSCWSKYVDVTSAQYIYYGSEFCNKRTPQYDEWEKLLLFCKEKSRTLVMTFPPTDVRTEDLYIDYLKRIVDSYGNKDIEIEVNDFGMLDSIECAKLSDCFNIRIGRVLDKTFHDCRLSENDSINLFQNANIRWYEDRQRIPQMVLKVLSRYHVVGMDIDLPTIIPEKSSFNHSLSCGVFVPYSYTTTGVVCQMQNIDRLDSEKLNIADHRCSRSCEKYYELLTTNRLPVFGDNSFSDYGAEPTITSYRVGNTIFYIRNISPQKVLDSGMFDRIIMEPRLML